MRIRSIKPEWLDDQRLASSSDYARVLSIALILLADDHGRGRAHQLFLAARAWPYGTPAETLPKVSGGLAELEQIGFVLIYEIEGQSYFEIRNWKKHQKISHPGKPLFPEPPKGLRKSSGASPPILGPDQEKEREREGSAEQPPPEDCPCLALNARDVAREWHRAASLPGGAVGIMHAEHSWSREYETVAGAITATFAESECQTVARAVCEWFWIADEGPIQAGRIPRIVASPAHLAKHIVRDLEGANAWWAGRTRSEGAAQ